MKTLVIALASFVLACTVARADDGPDYSAFVVGKFLSFVDPPTQGPIDEAPKLNVAFGAGPSRAAQMDTGSTGLVVSADQVPSLDGGRPCDRCLTYSSSGRVLTGAWVTLPVTITGGNGASVTTTPMPVLAVTAITCTAHPRNCKPEDHPSGVDLLGVGFAREHDHQPNGTPDANPFLNVQTPAASKARRGYVVTRGGVHVGLTRKNTLGDFHYVKLAPDENIRGEWQPAPACMAIDGASPTCGSLLVDTGVTSMFLTLPPQAVAGAVDSDGALIGGTQIQVSLPDSNGVAAAGYGITVGQSNDPLAPGAIHLDTTRPCPFVNTSVHFLNGFDILYDADGGFLAYRSITPAP